MNGNVSLDPLYEWCQRHPKTMGYLVLVTTANFILNVLNAVGIT